MEQTEERPAKASNRHYRFVEFEISHPTYLGKYSCKLQTSLCSPIHPHTNSINSES